MESDQGAMVAVMVRLVAEPGEEEMVEKQMAWFSAQCIEKEPGTLLYTIIKDEEGLGTMEIYQKINALKSKESGD